MVAASIHGLAFAPHGTATSPVRIAASSQGVLMQAMGCHSGCIRFGRSAERSVDAKGPRGLPGDTGQSVSKAMHPNVGKRSPQMPDRRNEMRKQRPSAPLVHSLGWFQNHSGNLIGTDDSLQLPRSPVRSGRISTLRRTNSREYPSFDPMTSTLSDTCRRP